MLFHNNATINAIRIAESEGKRWQKELLNSSQFIFVGTVLYMGNVGWRLSESRLTMRMLLNCRDHNSRFTDVAPCSSVF